MIHKKNNFLKKLLKRAKNSCFLCTKGLKKKITIFAGGSNSIQISNIFFLSFFLKYIFHLHVVSVSFVSATTHPSPDQASASRSQWTQRAPVSPGRRWRMRTTAGRSSCRWWRPPPLAPPSEAETTLELRTSRPEEEGPTLMI